MEIKTKALLLTVTPFREKDAIVHFLCEDSGVYTAMARGFYGNNKKYGFAVDYFNLLNIELKKGRGDMYNLSWVEPVHVFEGIRAALSVSGAAMMLLAVVRQVAAIAPGHGFSSITDALHAIEQTSEPWSEAGLGILNYMYSHGFSLWGSTCAECGRKIDLPFGISSQGRPLCKSCCGGQSRHLSKEFLAVLKKETADAPGPMVRDLDYFVQSITGRPVNLLRFLQLVAG